MILSQGEAQRVAVGRKAQHRISKNRTPPEIGTVVAISTKVPSPALGYQQNGEPRLSTEFVCQARIIGVWEADVQEATVSDAMKEGHESLHALREAWKRDHGELKKRTPVWVIAWELVHTPRFLSERVIAGKQSDYVRHPAKALKGELEAVDPATLVKFSSDARDADRARFEAQRAERDSLPLVQQVPKLLAECKARHIDVRDERRALKRFKHRPEAVQAAVEALRRKVDSAFA